MTLHINWMLHGLGNSLLSTFAKPQQLKLKVVTMDGWTDGWMNGWKDGSLDGWIDIPTTGGYSGNSLLTKRYTVIYVYLRLKMTFHENKRKQLVKFSYCNDTFIHSFTRVSAYEMYRNECVTFLIFL